MELAAIASAIASKQIAIGNVNALEFQLAQGRFLEAQLELLESEAEIIRLTEKLKRLLGLECDISLILHEIIIEEIDYQWVDLCTLESMALQERLDLQVAQFEIIRLSYQLGLKAGWSYTKLKGGLAGERDADGPNLIGPWFSGEIPIFNYGQAARMRLFAQLRQAQDYVAELEIRILSQVREAHKLLMSYVNIINEYEVTPRRDCCKVYL